MSRSLVSYQPPSPPRVTRSLLSYQPESHEHGSHSMEVVDYNYLSCTGCPNKGKKKKQTQSSRICKYFASGHCRFGNSCRFQHVCNSASDSQLMNGEQLPQQQHPNFVSSPSNRSTSSMSSASVASTQDIRLPCEKSRSPSPVHSTPIVPSIQSSCVPSTQVHLTHNSTQLAPTSYHNPYLPMNQFMHGAPTATPSNTVFTSATAQNFVPHFVPLEYFTSSKWVN